MKQLAALVVGIAATLAGAGIPGSVDASYGDGGWARLPVTTNVGVSSVSVSPEGAVAVTYAAEPEAGTAALVSPDGSAVTSIALPGPGVADFGPAGELVTAAASTEDTVVRRHLADGSVDAGFGTGGEVVLPGRYPADVAVAGPDVVVAGGSLGASAWVALLDHDGELAPGFGVVELVEDPTATAVATDVHVFDDGYLAVVLVRDSLPENEQVRLYLIDESGTPEPLSEFEPTRGEIFAVDSLQLHDGSVVVAVQTTKEDVDTFHLLRVLGDGTIDPSFESPDLTEDEVGGPVHLAQLPTGPILVAYNIGPEPFFRVRMVGLDGSDLGAPEVSDSVARKWMYGLTVAPTDGALLIVVDETPHSSAEPDDLSVVRVTGPGRFIDDDGSVHESDIERLAAGTVTRGCDRPTNVRFCPDQPVTRGQMAALIVRVLGLPPATTDVFVDDAASTFEADINRFAAAGITRGCDPPANTRFCPDDAVTREEMAAFLHRAFPHLPVLHPEAGAFADVWDPVVDEGTPPVFFRDIEWLARTGVTRGCDPPANTMFCPGDHVTRAQMASFLIRALPAP